VTEIVNMHDAKTNFSKLVAKVEAGEEIVIARGGRPCARLVPIVAEAPRLGTMKDRWPELADEFFEALTGDELDAWDA
jgi:prevent-host-death family protein